MVAESVDILWMQAKEAIERQDWQAARSLLTQAIAQKSDSPDLHNSLGTVCFQLEDLPSAAHHFKEVTRFDPLRAGAYINLGAIYNLLDQLDDAITALRRGLQLDPHRSEGYYNLGLVYRRKAQKDMAIQAYREALRVNPRMVDAYFNLGNLYMDKQQYSQAASAYRAALQLRPAWERALHGLAQADAALEAQAALLHPAKGTAAADAPDPGDTALQRPPLDPEKMVNPNLHSTMLTALHKATIDSENHGRHFLKILESEVEPAIKELSTCLLYPNSSSHELGQCVERLELVMKNMRGLQRQLRTSMEKIQNASEKLIET